MVYLYRIKKWIPFHWSRLSSGPPDCDFTVPTTNPVCQYWLQTQLRASPSTADGSCQTLVSRLGQDKGGRIPVGFSWHFWHYRWLFTPLFAMTLCDISDGCNMQLQSCHHTTNFLLWNIMIITGFRSAFIMISMWTSGLVSPPVICNIAALIPAFCANFLCECASRQGKMTLFKLRFFFSFCLDHCSFCMHPCLYNHICEHILLFTDHFQPCSFLVNANQTLPAAHSSQYELPTGGPAGCYCCKEVTCK